MQIPIIGWLVYAIYPFATPRINIPLEGKWKIALEDNHRFASSDYDDSGWESIQLPGSIINYSIKTKNALKSVCWLRKTVDLDNIYLPLGLCLGRIANADETHLNGEKYRRPGLIPTKRTIHMESQEKYQILASLIKKDTPNTIAIRISYYTFGDIVGKLMVVDMDYWEKLSREGLAETVKVHPDNLGKQFKQYTGKKLGDYFYELRVNYAAQRLREDDSNIIDIAFDAGFESLWTFNRVFPRFMDMTPIQYRNVHSKQKKNLN
ncbi:MAG: helix-turn-helix transcriptional regulator [Proteobacteria bacterium]|nr:helix-turn-helix transcriptional regulator [Pseudomonadota bacterium]